MGWRTAVAKRAILGRMPFGNEIRRAKRRLFGYEPDATNLASTLSHLAEMEAVLRSQRRSFAGATILEIGSGWFPTIPVMLVIGGAKKVFLSDLTPHMDAVTFSATLRFLSAHDPACSHLLTEKAFEDFPLTYLAPFRIHDVPDGSLDFIISRTVLEHIPKVDLKKLWLDLRVKLRSDGLMLHYIDHSDHLEHSDKSISKVNFLTWSVRKHAFINWLTKGGENRLRHHEYRQIFEDSGYDIVSTSTRLHEPTRAIINDLPLAEPFREMTPEEIAILSSLYVLTPRWTSRGQSMTC